MQRAARMLVLAALVFTTEASAQDGALPSWRDTATKTRIVQFVERVTRETGAEFVPAPQRIAVFDNDGTLWSEQPFYFQLAFALDRVHEMADEHPEWKTKQPFQAALSGDLKTLFASGQEALAELIMATHAGNTTQEFGAIAARWLRTAHHPQTGKLYTDMVYQPMLELMEYLRENDFEVFIVSGGGIEFLRVFSEEVYAVPPQQVVGSSIVTHYEVRDGEPVLVREPKLNFVDDGPGKPVGINQHIGRRPILAVGNSDGDFEMLEWSSAGSGARLGVLIHHDDADREYAYDRTSSIGHLERGLDEADGRGWLVVSMKRDWSRIFPVR